MLFLTFLDLNKNELRNAVVQNLATAPSSPSAGQLYFNTSDHLLYNYTGTEWKAVGAPYTLPIAGASTLGGVKIGSGLSINGTTGVASADVTSVAGKTGAVTLAKGDVGLGNVDNTADADKPVSTAMQTALDNKISKGNVTMTGYLAMNGYTLYLKSGDPVEDNEAVSKSYLEGKISALGSVLTFKGTKATTSQLPSTGNKTGDVWIVTADNSEYVWTGSAWEKLGTTVDLSGYATLASPAFTGVPTAPTAASGTDSTQIATTAFVQDAIEAQTIPSGSSTTPKMNGTATVGTENAWAHGDHIHPTDTSRAPLASPTFTGTPAAPTATAGTNTTQLATTAFVQTAISGKAPLASPALTGTPTAPTATTGTSTTQIATTAFVQNTMANAGVKRRTGTITAGQLSTSVSLQVPGSQYYGVFAGAFATQGTSSVMTDVTVTESGVTFTIAAASDTDITVGILYI